LEKHEVESKSPKRHKYTDEELAEAYVEYVIETGKEKPSSKELDKWKGISQSTWWARIPQAILPEIGRYQFS